MMQTETKLTARLVKAWREMGIEVLNIHGSAQQAPGWPDVFVCGKVWSCWIEFKGPKTVIQPHQKRIIKALGRTEQVWVVRFKHQIDDQWFFEYSDSNLNVLTVSNNLDIFIGTDGQVASQLLHALKKLDER